MREDYEKYGKNPVEWDEEYWKGRSLESMVRHLEETHHVYVRDEVDALRTLICRFEEEAGGEFDSVVALRSFFDNLSFDLLEHLKKEEDELFSVLDSLISGDMSADIKDTIQELENDHTEIAGEGLAARQLTVLEALMPDFPSDNLEEINSRLERFKRDLLIHIDFENNILFPSALKMESERRL